MSEFIVSGIIPGTRLQITFIVWIIVTAASIAFLLGRAGYRNKLIQAWLIAGRLMLAIRHSNLVEK